MKGPMNLGWILFAFCVLVKRTRSLTTNLHVRALQSKYSLLTAAATSRAKSNFCGSVWQGSNLSRAAGSWSVKSPSGAAVAT
uniref:Secreted protein n=1 Tax=Romanomermis culicivorax TaxID=13658 RepID=A0A915L6Y7_ROMCU